MRNNLGRAIAAAAKVYGNVAVNNPVFPKTCPTSGKEIYFEKIKNHAMHGHNEEKISCGNRDWAKCQQLCKNKCAERSWCRSFDYKLKQKKGKKYCWLSREDRNSKPDDFKSTSDYHYFQKREDKCESTSCADHCAANNECKSYSEPLRPSNKTKTGKTCKFWSETKYSHVGNHDHCTKAAGKKTEWCFYDDNGGWDSCDSVTKDDKKCRMWNDDTGDYLKQEYPEAQKKGFCVA